MSGTALHGAITALCAGFAGLSISGMTVTDGRNWNPGLIALEVAHTPLVNSEAATATRALNNGAASSHQEQIQIDCLLSVHEGRPVDGPTARQQLIDVFNQLEAWIATDPTLGSVVALAHIASYGYVPTVDIGDALATLRFTVAAVAFG